MDTDMIEPTIREAQELASRMAVAGEGRVLRIVFYGSRARGAPRSPASDWDFIVVLTDAAPEADEPWLERAAGGGDGRRLDIWVMDRENWETSRRLRGHPVRAASREGIALYDTGWCDADDDVD
jgi:predicted nucleotidyltransferase